MGAVNVSPTRRFIRILGAGWLAYLLLGVGLSRLGGGPRVTVIIDRSFCANGSGVVAQYAQLYAQHQQKQLTITSVILINNLGAEELTSPPAPESLKTFGLPDPEGLQRLQQAHPNAKVLTCGAPP
jgi:hypothetical protein